MKLARSLIAASALSLVSAAPVSAAVLYGTTGGGGAISELVTIDTTTGVTTTIGSVGFAINGLTMDPTTGTLYGSVRADGGLVSIDTATGAATVISSSFASPSVGCGSRNVLLAASGGGDLYGWCDPSSDDLMTIDKTTGLATGIVGNSGLSTFSHGMAFDAAGDLHLVNGNGRVYSIDTTTGASTLLGTVAQAHHGDFNPDNDLYYGLDGTGGTASINILDINGGGGPSLAGTLTADRSDLFALAFARSAAGVPEPSIVMLLGLGLAGLGVARKFRAA